MGQRRIVEGALRLLETATEPGTIVDLGERWGDDAWRANPLSGGSAGSGTGSGSGGGDSRTARHETPQYQTPDDARRAAERLGEEVACVACAVFDG